MIIQIEKPVNHDLSYNYGPYIDEFENSIFIDIKDEHNDKKEGE
jgi:hypothetical protein